MVLDITQLFHGCLYGNFCVYIMHFCFDTIQILANAETPITVLYLQVLHITWYKLDCQILLPVQSVHDLFLPAKTTICKKLVSCRDCLCDTASFLESWQEAFYAQQSPVSTGSENWPIYTLCILFIPCAY